MFEKVNPSHPDKIADRIAGAIVDLAYSKEVNPHIAVEVLIGHDNCFIILESDTHIDLEDIEAVVYRIADIDHEGIIVVDVPQDKHLNDNQKGKIRCGDNGIFKGVPTNAEEKYLSSLARRIYAKYPYDGKYVINAETGVKTICQSGVSTEWLKKLYPDALVNPLGDWTGGTDVDSGATNRKLGSDMGRAATGGGLHGKDLSKADVSVNIYAFLMAQATNREYEICCSIGDETVDGKPFEDIVNIARHYIQDVGGFEKFAEWGLV